MTFATNTSPFVGREGKILTASKIQERLYKETEKDVSLKVEKGEGNESWIVSGRGELHLSILIENMRREGYELGVSKPEVIFKEIDGVKCEPYEKVIVNTPQDYSGTVISDISERKGTMELMEPAEENYVRLEFLVPTRGLIGYRSNFITNTKGEGIMVRSFDSYRPYAGEIFGRKNGVLVTMETGKTFGYALYNLLDRGTMIVEPSTDVYEGMIVGIHNRDNDLNVNPCKNKEFSNTRSSGSDEAITLPKAKTFTLEEALEFIEIDELVEVTPDAVRLRKKILSEKERYRSYKK
jgi:GTP-binding protein